MEFELPKRVRTLEYVCNIWLRSDGRVERKGGYRHTDSWHEWLQDTFYGGSATKRIVIKEPSLFQYLVNSLLHTNQYGFRANYSTELALNELIDRIFSQLDEKKTYCHIYGPVKSIS